MRQTHSLLPAAPLPGIPSNLLRDVPPKHPYSALKGVTTAATRDVSKKMKNKAIEL